MLTAITAPFAGDATTTAQGGVLDLGADGALRLTLNNTSLGVNRVDLSSVARMSIAGGQVQNFTDAPKLGLNHVRSGAWIITSTGGSAKSGGVWATGFSPRPASVPTTGRLSYSGQIHGLISEYHITGGEGVALLVGKVQLESDFTTKTVTGKITGLRVGSDGAYVTGPVNELSFTATFNVASNNYIGEVVSGPLPGGPNAFQPGVRGLISGQFFGPGAMDSGAVLVLSDGTSRLIISFSATSEVGCPGCWDY